MSSGVDANSRYKSGKVWKTKHFPFEIAFVPSFGLVFKLARWINADEPMSHHVVCDIRGARGAVGFIPIRDTRVGKCKKRNKFRPKSRLFRVLVWYLNSHGG